MRIYTRQNKVLVYEYRVLYSEQIELLCYEQSLKYVKIIIIL